MRSTTTYARPTASKAVLERQTRLRPLLVGLEDCGPTLEPGRDPQPRRLLARADARRIGAVAPSLDGRARPARRDRLLPPGPARPRPSSTRRRDQDPRPRSRPASSLDRKPIPRSRNPASRLRNPHPPQPPAPAPCRRPCGHEAGACRAGRSAWESLVRPTLRPRHPPCPTRRPSRDPRPAPPPGRPSGTRSRPGPDPPPARPRRARYPRPRGQTARRVATGVGSSDAGPPRTPRTPTGATFRSRRRSTHALAKKGRVGGDRRAAGPRPP